jgi:hypothetical protein
MISGQLYLYLVYVTKSDGRTHQLTMQVDSLDTAQKFIKKIKRGKKIISWSVRTELDLEK